MFEASKVQIRDGPLSGRLAGPACRELMRQQVVISSADRLRSAIVGEHEAGRYIGPLFSRYDGGDVIQCVFHTVHRVGLLDRAKSTGEIGRQSLDIAGNEDVGNGCSG
jgi:hypothetical protein